MKPEYSMYKHLCTLMLVPGEKDGWKYTDIIEYALHTKGVERDEFVEAYLESGPYALANIGYFAGYYDGKTAHKIMQVFKTEHPIFGAM